MTNRVGRLRFPNGSLAGTALVRVIDCVADTFPEYVAFGHMPPPPAGYRRIGPGHYRRIGR